MDKLLNYPLAQEERGGEAACYSCIFEFLQK